MNKRAPTAAESLASNPAFVGALTVLIVAVALFLAYNANKGLPFVPTYRITAEMRDAQGLIPANDVTVGGSRVGVVDSIEPELGANGRPYSRVELKLSAGLQGHVYPDATVAVRPSSLFEAKYLALDPGSRGKPLPADAVLPISHSRPPVSLSDAFAVFNAPTRRNLQRVLNGGGNGLAGRGEDFNQALGNLVPLLRNVQPLLADLVDPATRLGRFIRAYAAVGAELAPAAGDLGSLISDARITLAALDAAGPELEATLAALPGTIAVGTDSLTALRAPLRHAQMLGAALRPAGPLLAPTTAHLVAAVETGIPVIQGLPPVADRLYYTLAALRRLAANAPLAPSLRLLKQALPKLRTTLRYLGPYQTVCNYPGLASRNVPSAFSEGTPSGTWLRFYPIIQTAEGLQSAAPAPDLHYDPYPNGAAPGQTHECEAGNEKYVPGQQIGQVPGEQGTKTQQTDPGGTG